MAIIGPVRNDFAHSVSDDELRALLSAVNAPQGCRSLSGEVQQLRYLSDRILRWRRIQRDIFPEAVFRESCWDIMLLCFTGQLADRRIYVKQLRNELDESGTALLRRIQELEDAGMIRRQRDEMDGRRTVVRLTDTAIAAMSRFFRLINERTPG